jgi:hypothetical protein
MAEGEACVTLVKGGPVAVDRLRAASFGRVALGLVRLANGVLGLCLPGMLIGRIDPVAPPSPAAVYAFRLFGVRTLLLGRDLLWGSDEVRAKAVAEAPLIHAADTVTATLLTVTGRLPVRSGAPLMAISSINTLLALLARRG